MTAGLETLLQGARVLDDPVMYNRDVAFAVDVRVRIAFVGNAVGCPAGVSDAGVTLDRARGQRPLQLRDLPCRLSRLDAAAVHHCYPRRVVAAILHAFEALEQQRCCATRSDITDNSTHSLVSLTVLLSPQRLHGLPTIADEFFRGFRCRGFSDYSHDWFRSG